MVVVFIVLSMFFVISGLFLLKIMRGKRSRTIVINNVRQWKDK